MMKLYIAYDEKGLIESIVLARSRELADVYWQGAGVVAINVKRMNPSAYEDHLTGVVPVLKTNNYNIGSFFEPKNIRQVIK